MATIKTESKEKFLILRRKYHDEVPSEDMSTFNMGNQSCSASLMSLPTDISDSPIRRAPPLYRAPPPIDNFSYIPPPAMSSQVLVSPQQPSTLQHHPIPPSMTTVGLPIFEPQQQQTKEQYKECASEFQQVMTNFMDTRVGGSVASRKNSFEQIIEEQASQSPSLPPRGTKQRIDHRSISRENSMEQPQFDSNREENKENNQIIMTSPSSMGAAATADTEESKLSVREAMLKFNRFASEEEAEKLIPSPISKAVKSSKTEKVSRLNEFFYLYDSA